jgi:hypothetical protein
MLLMDVQIWIGNHVANDPHGVVERAAPGELPMDHAQSCLTGKGEMWMCFMLHWGWPGDRATAPPTLPRHKPRRRAWS